MLICCKGFLLSQKGIKNTEKGGLRGKNEPFSPIHFDEEKRRHGGKWAQLSHEKKKQ